MFEVVISIASFFGGSFLTMVVFVVGYSSRLTRVETTLKGVDDQLKRLDNLKIVEPPCQFLGEVKSEVRLHGQRLDQIEAREQ